ncbi:MAG: ATP-dependent helicase Lhr and Lhr-like helicase [Chthoniobacter sp.]|jgi:ATP-dependent Lhr-like helicase|nr:ATP-dependent helicase Lhr and Lhr-like helicase [Chthoniobacter sp.]
MSSPGRNSRVFAWFRQRYGRPTPAQRAAWPLLARGANVLIASPTGTGKTFAAFLSVLDALAQMHEGGTLRDAIHCVYVSPLRALGYDLEKNLNEPLRELFGEKPPIRVELRTGDTSASQRARQFVKPPHILLTTPESLCVLLSQAKWLPVLGEVRWLIVDEIHALADNKRGAHLTLSIERLDRLRRSAFGVAGQGASPSAEAAADGTSGGRPTGEVAAMQRIGLSATVAPLAEVAQFLVGTHGQCEIVDVTTAKKLELRVHTPLRKNPYPEAGFTGQRLIRELGGLIKKHRTTLIFCNVRSGAEATTFWLRENFPELADVIECHHASLERDVRREVEDRLKRGELRAVVCSTSLELGIDIGAIELVVMMSTPKGVSKALQRAGRAGHNIHAVSRGVLMATNVADLVEACATALLARTRHLEEVRVPQAPLDVLAQHLVSMGCTARWNRAEAFALVRSAFPFRSLDQIEFDDVLDYLAGGGQSLRRQYTEVFGKIDLDAETFETRPGRVQRDFLQNVGVIPSVGSVRVRSKTRALGSVEESFIRWVRIGDVFMIAGRPVRLDRVSTMEAWVTPAPGALPTVPRWNASKMPLSNRVCEEIVAFRREFKAQWEAQCEADLQSAPHRADGNSASHQGTSQLAAWIARRLDCGNANAEIILKTHLAQLELSEIPTADFLLVEEFLELPQEPPPTSPRGSKAKRRAAAPVAIHYFFHSLIGRAANDALARVVTLRLSRFRGGNAIATPHDYGFVLTVAPQQQFNEEELRSLLRVEGFGSELENSLAQSEMLKYHFRNAAQTGLMVYRNFFDQHKPTRKLAWSAEVIFNVLQQHEPDHVLLREARRDILRVFLDAEGALAYLTAQADRPVRLRRVPRVPPLSFAMYATKIKEALLVEDPWEVQERLFNLWWKQIENSASSSPSSS